MLSKEALKERMWGPYPALRKLLEDKKIPDRFYGFSSVSDNIFNRTERLMKIIILVREFIDRDKIRQNENVELLYEDLYRLLEEVVDQERFFRDAKEEIQRIL